MYNNISLLEGFRRFIIGRLCELRFKVGDLNACILRQSSIKTNI
jgi:hypothetical protein